MERFKAGNGLSARLAPHIPRELGSQGPWAKRFPWVKYGPSTHVMFSTLSPRLFLTSVSLYH